MKRINFKSLLLLILFGVFNYINTSAQDAPIKQWDKTLGGNDRDNPFSMISTPDGGFLLGGFSSSNKNGDKSEECKGGYDYWVIKIDANGNRIWDKTFGGNSPDELFSMLVIPTGGFLLGGWSSSNKSGNKSEDNEGVIDYWLIKIDVNGNKIWDKTLGGNKGDFLSSMVVTPDGSFLLGGWSNSDKSGDKSESNKGSNDYWLIKIDANGNKVWDKTFGGDDNDVLNSMLVIPDGGFLLGGISYSNKSGDKSEDKKGEEDYWLIKIDNQGNKVWDKTIAGNIGNRLFSMVITFDGGVLLGGSSWSDKIESGTWSEDYFIIKVDAQGNKIWDKALGGSNYDYLISILNTIDGGFLLGGVSYSNKGWDKSENKKGEDDYWIVAVDANGNKIWDKTLGGDAEDQLHSMIATYGGGFLLGGFSYSNKSGDKSENNKGYEDYWVIKFNSTITALSEFEKQVQISLYPNPSQGNLNLKMANTLTKELKISVLHSSGKIVWQKSFQTDAQIDWETSLDLSHLPQGLYFLEIENSKGKSVKKIIVEK